MKSFCMTILIHYINSLSQGSVIHKFDKQNFYVFIKSYIF